MITKDKINAAGWNCTAMLDLSRGRYGRQYTNKEWPDLTATFLYERNGSAYSRSYTWRGQTYPTGDALVEAMNKILP